VSAFLGRNIQADCYRQGHAHPVENTGKWVFVRYGAAVSWVQVAGKRDAYTCPHSTLETTAQSEEK